MLPESPTPPADAPVVFRHLLVNTLVSGVTSSFLWFALTFWVYLETHSVVATGVIGGAFGLASAAIGPAFGTYVDHHRKKDAMVLATTTSAACFAVATVVFLAVDPDQLLQLDAPWFWILVTTTANAITTTTARIPIAVPAFTRPPSSSPVAFMSRCTSMDYLSSKSMTCSEVRSSHLTPLIPI